jgi:hypothetical protein
VVALQVLTSGLYHYGHNDLIATRPSKRDFLCYIRDEVIEKGEKEAMRLTEEGARQAVAVEVLPVETEDTNSTVLSEAAKGYRAVLEPPEGAAKKGPLQGSRLLSSRSRPSSFLA